MSDENQNNTAPELQSAPPPPENTSSVRDKRLVPEGVVPRQAQGYVVAGLAVLILMAVMFSKNHAKPAVKRTTITPPAASTDLNQRRIQELEQDLSADQRQSQQEAQQQKTSVVGAAGATAGPPASTQVGGPASPAGQSPTPAAIEPPRDPFADAEKAMAFKARFASNLVSSDASASRPSASPADSARSETDSSTPSARSANSPSQAPASQTAAANKRAAEVNLNSAHGQPFAIFEGTTIDTVLVDRLDGEFAGSFKVMVTNPIYSHDNQHVLIPEGTFLLGEVQKVSGPGQRRLAVTFHRMIMPDGYSVDLDKFHGLNQIGETGLNDKVNNHYVEIFGTSIALGVIAGASEATTNTGYNQSGSDSIRQGMSSRLSASAAHVLDRFINIMPTITIHEGHRIKVYLTQDLLLPAYENHSIPGDI